MVLIHLHECVLDIDSGSKFVADGDTIMIYASSHVIEVRGKVRVRGRVRVSGLGSSLGVVQPRGMGKDACYGIQHWVGHSKRANVLTLTWKSPTCTFSSGLVGLYSNLPNPNL